MSSFRNILARRRTSAPIPSGDREPETQPAATACEAERETESLEALLAEIAPEDRAAPSDLSRVPAEARWENTLPEPPRPTMRGDMTRPERRASRPLSQVRTPGPAEESATRRKIWDLDAQADGPAATRAAAPRQAPAPTAAAILNAGSMSTDATMPRAGTISTDATMPRARAMSTGASTEPAEAMPTGAATPSAATTQAVGILPTGETVPGGVPMPGGGAIPSDPAMLTGSSMPTDAITPAAAADPMPAQSPIPGATASTPVAPASEMPAPAPPPARAARVKTRLLGFHADDATIDAAAPRRIDATQGAIKHPVGWVVVVDGPGRGAHFALGQGLSTLGRAPDQAICLDFGDDHISRDNHASIAYDEEENKVLIGHGGKSNIVRLNGKPLVSSAELSNGDLFRVGKTTLRFVALCGADFSWQQAREGAGADG